MSKDKRKVYDDALQTLALAGQAGFNCIHFKKLYGRHIAKQLQDRGYHISTEPRLDKVRKYFVYVLYPNYQRAKLIPIKKFKSEPNYWWVYALMIGILASVLIQFIITLVS